MQHKVCKVFRAAVSCAFLLGVFLVLFAVVKTPVAHATVGINQQINFQGRLYTAAGAVVPDGTYNIQFKIYQDGDGLTAGNTTGTPAGSLKWTESYLNTSTQGVSVINGFMSVQLGSITPFGTNVDWNQNTLWLSMNIGTTNGTCTPFTSCTPDGEMVPMKRLSATPYALNAGQLGGLSAAGFIQNTTTPSESKDWLKCVLTEIKKLPVPPIELLTRVQMMVRADNPIAAFENLGTEIEKDKSTIEKLKHTIEQRWMPVAKICDLPWEKIMDF